MSLRYEPGGGEMAGRMSVYRGPLLLAYDVLLNDKGPPEPAPFTPADLQKATISFPSPAPDQARIGRFLPWLIVDVPRSDGTSAAAVRFRLGRRTGQSLRVVAARRTDRAASAVARLP